MPKEPRRPGVTREGLSEDPVQEFRSWYREAKEESGLDLPEAVCLSTVGEEGYPDARFVLLKDVDSRGFVFYTNLESRKAEALRACPRAALTFYWEPLRRQIRIQGEVERVREEEADEYFRTRPRGSQLAAWASEQSAPLRNREELEARFREMEDRFQDRDIPRPPFWSGFRVLPRAMEFWQEGPDRLHDRFRYRRTSDGWTLVRLAP